MMEFFKKCTCNKAKVIKGIFYFFFLPVLTHATKTHSVFPDFLDSQIEAIEILCIKKDTIKAIEMSTVLFKSLNEKITSDEFKMLVRLKDRLFASEGHIAENIKMELILYNLYCKEQVEDKSLCGPCRSIQYSLGKLMQSINKHRSSINYLTEICPDNFHFHDAYHLAFSYQKLGKIDSAYMVLENKIDESKRIQDWDAVTRTYNNLGLIAQKAENYDFSIECYQRSIEFAEKYYPRNRAFRSVVQGNIGASYAGKGDFEIARNYLLLDIEQSLEHNLLESYLNASIIISRVDFQTKHFNSSKNRLENILKNEGLPWTIDRKIEANKILLKTYIQLQNQKEAEKITEQIGSLEEKKRSNEIAYNNEVLRSFADQLIENLETEKNQELKIRNQELEILKIEGAKRETRYILILSTIIFSLLIGIQLFMRYRKEKILETTIIESKNLLIEKEKEILEAKFLEEHRNAEQLSLELTYKEQIIDRFKRKLKVEDISPTNKRSLEIFLQNELKVNSIRSETQSKLGKSRSLFYVNLKKSHPNLTANETNLASLVVLEKSNKEIANSKNIAVTSVKQAKNRLKKKLKIAENHQLHIYLRDFLN